MATMPDIDHTADIKVTAAKGTVTAEIPLAGRASGYWLELFRLRAPSHTAELRIMVEEPEAEEREDRTWVIVKLSSDRPDYPERLLDSARTLISEVNGMEQQFQSGAAEIEAVVRAWWARQQECR
jgi:hypothetical protein